MTKYQKTLLAGVAALAIAAGTGFASAQTRGGGSTGGAAAGGSSAAASESPSQSGGMSGHQGAAAKEHSGSSMKSQADKGGSAEQTGKKSSSKSAEEGKKSSAKSADESGSRSRSAEEPTKSGKHHAQGADRGSKEKNGTASSEMKRHPKQGTAEREKSGTERGKGTAEREHSLRGLQGNASEPMQGAKSSKSGREGASRGEGANVAPEGGTSVHLSEQQRTHLKQTIIEGHNAPRADHVDFDVRVGTVVPRGSIHVTTVPETLVRIEPRWRGYEYFVYEDEIVIVDPHDMHIVAVVSV